VPRPPTTSRLRTATGLDEGARKALLRALLDSGLDHGKIVMAFLNTETYGDLGDYIEAVREVWGPDAGERMPAAIEQWTARLAANAGPPPVRWTRGC
jgi:hypothetical protein